MVDEEEEEDEEEDEDEEGEEEEEHEHEYELEATEDEEVPEDEENWLKSSRWTLTRYRDTSSLRALTDTFQFFQSVQQQQSFRFVQGWKTGLKRRQFLGFKKTCGKKPRKFIFLGFLFFSCCAV